MPWRNQNFWESLISFLSTHTLLLSSFLLTVFISVFSTAKKYGKVDWIEAFLCGFLTLTIASILGFFNLPEEFAIFVGGFVGFKGSKWVDQKFNEQYDKRINKDDHHE